MDNDDDNDDDDNILQMSLNGVEDVRMVSVNVSRMMWNDDGMMMR